MKLVVTVLMLSAAELCASPAGKAIAQENRFTKMEQPKVEDLPAGSCMPIGLTAQGEIVFPWACQELIEKHRGSKYIPNPSKDPASNDSTASQSAQPELVIAAPELSRAPPKVTATADKSEGRQKRVSRGRPHRRQVDTASQPGSAVTGAIK
jgi:hypothetical protein